MGYVKGKSAMVLRDRHPEWGRVVGRDKTFWAWGYYVSTVGLNEEAIRRYVAEQEDGSRFEQVEVRAAPFRGVPACCSGHRGLGRNRQARALCAPRGLPQAKGRKIAAYFSFLSTS